ncbi:Na+/H+ antiporter NhaA [Microbispora triticiradicis]|uniref:Na(+)/H(+) antiporter NhaA n=2 Tax=Microbispora TaxID=2005 RepID=A0ABY3M1B9_9ACTN|nr:MULTISPECIES: Na+/H+ antiporter NhaA [Microbispora]TLP52848.1 Na+/H+ antiporter NhaA [Microbispora fusca]TYB62925.1 Na+/H+ antiporter NhaA [Microbispora tritici]
MSTPRRTPLLGPGSRTETRRIADILRQETIGGALLLIAALAALVWANSPWSAGYETLRSARVGPEALHLDLSLAAWAADGLLAIFFFVAGLELKREFVAGDLRDPRRAAVPVVAAAGGVVVPALLYLLVNTQLNPLTGPGADGALRGWAVPTATDIAFALAVLAVVGRNLPSALRTFLLTLAVVDDLLAIAIIAVFYTTHLAPLPLLAALLPLGLFAVLVRRGVRAWWLLAPLAAVTWALVHASGVHATVAGVLLAFTVPVLRARRKGTAETAGEGTAEGAGPAEHFEHRFRPLSAGVAVPLFAFLSAGVAFGGPGGLPGLLTDGVPLGVVAGLVAGKPLGITAATWLVARFTRAGIDEGLAWVDIVGVAVLSGIGFTVSLLIGELAFGAGSTRDGQVKVAVLTGSLVAALLATVILRLRDRVYRRLAETEADAQADAEAEAEARAAAPPTT